MKEQQTDLITPRPKKWQAEDQLAWFEKQIIKRSYQNDVLRKITALATDFRVEQYGELCYSPYNYPLYIVTTRDWDNNKPSILITGGVHGYETSGVHGALRFIEKHGLDYAEKFNIAVAPCISPWGYETVNRWNPHATDPNRSFYQSSPSQEASQLMEYVKKHRLNFMTHIDLHETTDTDNTEFRPALTARDGVEQELTDIPDGFYLVADTNNPKHDFQSAIIEAVRKVTHIAPVDANGKIIGESISQDGVIHYDTKQLGLCNGFTNALYCTTTEVYPDSLQATGEDCINAQVAAVTGGLDYLINQNIV
jgi:hypothetical protein